MADSCVSSRRVLSTVGLGHLMSRLLSSSIIYQKGPGFSISTLPLSSSPKMQWTSSAVVGVKLCINSLNALRHWFNISAWALKLLTLSWTRIVLLWTAILWLWVISCPFPSVTSGIWTKFKNRCFLTTQKVCDMLKFVFSAEEAALCFSLPLSSQFPWLTVGVEYI